MRGLLLQDLIQDRGLVGGEIASLATAISRLIKATGIFGIVALCVGCQIPTVGTEKTQLRGPHDTAIPAAVEPHSAGHLNVYRDVLLKSRAAPLRAEAARELGEHLADDEKSIRALSIATNDDNLAVKQAARKAFVRIFDARHQGMEDEEGQLEELGRVAQEQTHRLGQGAIEVVKWLWNNVYIWPGFNQDERAVAPLAARIAPTRATDPRIIAEMVQANRWRS